MEILWAWSLCWGGATKAVWGGRGLGDHFVGVAMEIISWVQSGWLQGGATIKCSLVGVVWAEVCGRGDHGWCCGRVLWRARLECFLSGRGCGLDL